MKGVVISFSTFDSNRPAGNAGGISFLSSPRSEPNGFVYIIL